MGDVKQILSQLDAPFLKFDKTTLNEPIVWKGDNVLLPVQKSFDIGVPAMAGSTIKYSFSSEIGDVEYSTEFLVPGHESETIVSKMRVPSDVETIHGSYKAVREGTFVITFDNNFSWFNPKMLTYKISLFQPAFKMADKNRVAQCRRLLQVTAEDTHRAKVTAIKAQEKAKTLSTEIEQLQAHIASLSADIEQKQTMLKSSKDEVQEMSARIKFNLEKKAGLCIRYVLCIV